MPKKTSTTMQTVKAIAPFYGRVESVNQLCEEAKQVAIYARSATPPEAGAMNATASQVQRCKEFAKGKGYQLLDELFIEDVGSGLKINPGLHQNLDARPTRLAGSV